MTPRIGSVCTGYGGLDMAVQQVLGGELAWVADPDPGAAAILAHHHPGVPNLGDITVTDWETVPPVDVLCGGYPCQPFSLAGKRKGTADDRHIWPFIARALGVLRPRLAIFENVQGHLRLGFDTVLADLAGLGFDAEWCLVRASEVGAAHQRNRLILLAWPADTESSRLPWPGLRGRAAERGGAAADADSERGPRPRAGRQPAQRHAPGAGGAATHAKGERRGEGRPEPARQQGRPGAAIGRGATAPHADRDTVRQQPVTQPRRGAAAVAELTGPHVAAHPDRGGLAGHRELPAGRDTVRIGLRVDADGQRPPAAVDVWGQFAPAVARWEHTTGRRAPRATDARNRLNPLFVEWLMGLPWGHVTHVPGLSRTQQLKALGNGVVPQQATAALRLLLDRAVAA